jgi:DNA-binding Lrp family transcriptional regulator
MRIRIRSFAKYIFLHSKKQLKVFAINDILFKRLVYNRKCPEGLFSYSAVKMGGIDLQEILELLEKNDRYTPAEIAVMLGITEDEVKAKIAELETEKVIINYRAMVNWERAGVEKVTALIEVKVIPQRDVGFDEIAERIYRFSEVKSVFLMSGAYDLMVLVEGATMKEVALFVSQKLATIHNVQSTATHFVLKKYKLEGVIMDGKEEVERLVITP